MTPSDIVVRLNIATSRGAYPNGQNVSDALRRLQDIGPLFIGSTKVDIGPVCDEISNKSEPTSGIYTADPMSGFRTDFPLGSLLVHPNKSASTITDPINWLLVRFALDNPKAAKNLASDLSFLIQQLQADSDGHSAELMKSISRAIGRQDTVSRVLECWEQVCKRFKPSVAARDAGIRLIQKFGKPKGRQRISLTDSYTGFGTVIYDRTGQPEIYGESRPQVEILSIPDLAPEVEKRPALERANARINNLLIAQELYPDGPDVLTAVEASACIAWMLTEFQRAMEAGIDLRARAICLASLAFLTSRSADNLLETETGLDADPDCHRIGLTSDFRFWIGCMPNDGSLSTADGIEQDCGDVRTYGFYPIPIEIRNLFQRCFGRVSEFDQVSLFKSGSVETKEIRAAAQEIIAELRIQVTPRCSWERIRLCVPAHLREQSSDPAMAQIVAGSTLGAGPAPLNYYSAPLPVINENYTNAASKALGLRFEADYSSVAWNIGSALSAVQDQDFLVAVQHLQSAISHAVHQRSPEERIRETFESVTAYTAWMQIANKANRGTYWIESFSLSACDLNSRLVIERDKIADAAHIERPTAISQTAVQQLEILQRIYLRTADFLEKGHRKGDPEKAHYLQAAARIRRAARGDGPLFMTLTADFHASDISMDWLKGRLPQQWKAPNNIFRHRLRRLLTEAKVDGRLIYMQMGHIYDGHVAFNADCPLSPLEFAEALSPVLESVLSRDGWKALPVRVDRELKPELALVTSLDYRPLQEWSETIRKYRAYLKKKRKGGFALKKKDSKACKAWVLTQLMSITKKSFQLDAPPRNIKLNESEIKEVIQSLTQDETMTGDRIDAYLIAIRSQVKEYQQKFGWTGRIPPRAFWLPSEASPVGVPHIKAHVLMQAVRNYVIKPDESKATIRGNAALARLVILLLSEGVVTTYKHLEKILDALPGGILLQGDLGDRVLFDIQVEQGGVVRSYAQSISVACAIAARSWINAGAPRPIGISELDICVWEYLPKSIRPVRKRETFNRLLDVSRAARRISQPGVRWSILESEILNTLSVKRTEAVVTNWNAKSKVPLSDEPKSSDVESSPAGGRTSKSENQENFGILRREISRMLAHGVQSHIRSRCIQFIDEFLLGSRGEISHLLAMYVRWLITRPDRPVAVSSAYQYLTRIGAALVDSLNNKLLTQMAGDKLEVLYTEIVMQKNDEIQFDVAWTLIQFHNFLGSKVAEIDESEIFDCAVLVRKNPEVGLITEREFSFVLEGFRAISKSDSERAGEAKELSISSTLMYRLGLRKGEAKRIRFKDVFTIGSLVFVSTLPRL